MTISPITFVYEPPRTSTTPPLDGPGRYAGFIDELGRRSSQQVTTIYGPLRDALRLPGFIVLEPANHTRFTLDEVDPARRTDLAARLIVLSHNEPTRIIEEILEPLSIAGAIDMQSVRDWELNDPTRMATGRLYGRRDIGEMAGAQAGQRQSLQLFNWDAGGLYCHLQSSGHFGLPHLLADYLGALERSTGIVSTVDPTS